MHFQTYILEFTLTLLCCSFSAICSPIDEQQGPHHLQKRFQKKWRPFDYVPPRSEPMKSPLSQSTVKKKKCKPYYQLDCPSFCPEVGNKLDFEGCKTCKCCESLSSCDNPTQCDKEKRVVGTDGCPTCQCKPEEHSNAYNKWQQQQNFDQRPYDQGPPGGGGGNYLNDDIGGPRGRYNVFSSKKKSSFGGDSAYNPYQMPSVSKQKPGSHEKGYKGCPPKKYCPKSCVQTVDNFGCDLCDCKYKGPKGGKKNKKFEFKKLNMLGRDFFG